MELTACEVEGCDRPQTWTVVKQGQRFVVCRKCRDELAAVYKYRLEVRL